MVSMLGEGLGYDRQGMADNWVCKGGVGQLAPLVIFYKGAHN